MRVNVIRKILRATCGLDLHRYHYQPDRLTWLADANIRTVFDIGANVGQFAAEIRYQLPNAQIYSFEPLRECYEKLAKSFSRDSRFQAFNHAIGDTEGSAAMNRSCYSSSSSLRPMANSHKTLFPHTGDSVPEQITVRRLDDVHAELNPRPQILIKVDTQGYEDKVIAGGRTSFKQAKVVLIEACFVELYEGQPLFDDIYESLKSLGFSYEGALSQNINRQTGEVLFEDAIFVQR